jgi:exosome complex component RRP45
MEIARLVERCVRDAGAVDTETLCIVAGQRVWSLKIDLRVLNYEGNMTDCCALAAVCALLYYRRPDITVTSHSVTVHSEEERNYIPLQLHFWPITTTFSLFESIDDAVVDPSLTEDLTCDAHLTVAMNAQKDVCCIQKPGGIAVSHDMVMQCVGRASARTLKLVEYIKKEHESKLDSKKHVIHAQNK